MKFIIKGSANQVSKEEVRALLHASATILDYHNADAGGVAPILVRFVTRFKGEATTAGQCQDRNIWLRKDLNYDTMLTTILHEVIHAYRGTLETEEKVVSTLTARLKNDVARLANILVENTYKRAAYIAHAKISYKPEDGIDYYDSDQWHKEHPQSTGRKYRKGALCATN